MEELSFFDKLLVLWDNVLDHPLFIVIFFIPVLLFFLQKRHGKKVFIISYFLVIFTLLIFFGDIIFKLFDNLMDGLFMFLYFPNFISLFFIILVCSLIALVSLFSKNVNNVSRAINYISFGIIQSLFALILIIVKLHKVNIYKADSLYTDKDVLALMQILTFVFTVQIISNVIIHIINKATESLDNKANFSSGVTKQIIGLAEGKIKSFEIDNDKVGFINVADKKTTSKPILKPFKFDVEKLQSITIDTPVSSKGYIPYNIVGTDFSYANEVIPIRVFKPFVIDSNSPFYLNVSSKPYKSFNLKDLNVTYFNEIIVHKDYKIVSLDSSKFIYLDVPKKYYSLFKLDGSDFSYLNEVSKNYKPFVMDSSKFIYLDVPKKSYELFKLDDKEVTYSHEVVSQPSKDKNINKGYRLAYIDPNKSVSVLLSDESNKKPSIRDRVTTYLSDFVNRRKYKSYDLDSKRVSDYSVDYDISNDEIPTNEENIKSGKFIREANEKPNLFEVHEEDLKHDSTQKPIVSSVPVVKPIFSIPGTKHKLVENLKIIDIQSMLDVAVNYHFMKGVNLYTYDKITVQNLKICNYKLLLDILKVYKLFK